MVVVESYSRHSNQWFMKISILTNICADKMNYIQPTMLLIMLHSNPPASAISLWQTLSNFRQAF